MILIILLSSLSSAYLRGVTKSLWLRVALEAISSKRILWQGLPSVEWLR